MMIRRLTLTALTLMGLAAFTPASAAAPAPLPAEDQALVERASAYLDGLGQMHGRFTQTDPRGGTSQGELYLSRPGKARFDYQSPASMLVVSDGHAVLVYDRRLKTFDRYPLGSTPLALFLQKHVRLDQKVQVTRVDRRPGEFSITARDGGHKAQGQITLTFADSPMSLLEWSILDAQGGRTSVRLDGLQPASGLDPKLFVLTNPNPATR